MSERFESAWLELREPVDHRSRADALVDPLAVWWVAHGGSTVVDLGSGTGSNLRYLAPRLPGHQRWTLVDHDAALLARVRAPAAAVDVRTVVGDLSDAGLAQAGAADLVTAAALLDLVFERWIEELVDACVGAGSGALFALTYDGTVDWGGGDPLDALVRDAVNAHQRRDKGVGSALGPVAADTAVRAFRARGYHTRLEATPWRLGPEDAELARELIDGWARAASEQRPGEAAGIRSWAGRRSEDAGRSGFALVVGHRDLLALPGAP